MDRITRVKIAADIEIIIRQKKARVGTKYVMMGDCDLILYFTSLEGYDDAAAVNRFRNINREFPGLQLYKKIGPHFFLFSKKTGRFRRVAIKSRRLKREEKFKNGV
ncbi:MAG: hypothetical protein JST_000399 [Candidatus Parcubacteria bacterium]|jgi:hypothetical protein